MTSTSWRSSPAHPRSRGEHQVAGLALIVASGSSPLARGTHISAFSDAVMARLIPARAGNTSYREPRLDYASAHPRSRGEHVNGKWISERETGSSPLARGTHSARFTLTICTRLIPARAGNTVLRLPRSVCEPAHPRSRGEHPGRFRKRR